jgi:hypothetical protein
MNSPSSDDVARAIIAACRETGDDPARTVTGEALPGQPTNRARHYAMHALLHVFPDLERHAAARLVGCPGKPAAFWNASYHQVIKPRAGAAGHVAGWFNDRVYERVIAAVEAGLTLSRSTGSETAVESQESPAEPQPTIWSEPDHARQPVVRLPAKPARNLGTLEPGGCRPPPGTIADILRDELDERPVIDRNGRHREYKKPTPWQALAGKSQLMDELRKAVENTAKMTPPKND